MVSAPHPQGPRIPEFYSGKSVFITGATGFVGKVLLERLLSTCPDIGRLYLLLRTKKGVTPEQRLQQLKQSQVFDVVRESCPSQLDKLCIIPGDTAQPQLGLAVEALAQIREVSIVFHSAATLKFDEELRKAVDQNVRSVMRLLEICDTLPNIEAFIHVSTAYCNAELDVVEERVYPSPAPLGDLLALVDSAPPHLLAEITNKYIHPKPNTYCFTKAVAENVVNQHGACARGYSIAIFRPTIVISARQHPFPGWIENLNGPSGVVVASGKGLLHVFCCESGARADLLPVDLAVDTLIAAAWETAIDRSEVVRVYNCSTYDHPTTWRQFEKEVRKNIRSHPLDKVFWYPSGATTSNSRLEQMFALVLQTIPLYVTEYTLRLFGQNTQISLITADQRLRAMSSVLKFFSLKEWRFETNNVRRLRERLTAQDANIYNLDPHTIDWESHYVNFVKGTRKYLLKEKDQDLDEAKKHIKRMSYVHHTFMFISCLLFLRFILQNHYARNIIYGTLRLLLSLIGGAYSRVKSN